METAGISTHWQQLAEASIAGERLSREQARSVLDAGDDDMLALVDAAYRVRRTFHGNTMVFGLAALSWGWIAACALVRTPLMRSARSTVLWSYGLLAMAAMGIRVLLEPSTALDAEPFRLAMNYAGPLLMALALAVATYTSRSIVPADTSNACAVSSIVNPQK